MNIYNIWGQLFTSNCALCSRNNLENDSCTIWIFYNVLLQLRASKFYNVFVFRPARYVHTIVPYSQFYATAAVATERVYFDAQESSWPVPLKPCTCTSLYTTPSLSGAPSVKHHTYRQTSRPGNSSRRSCSDYSPASKNSIFVTSSNY